MNLSIVTKEMFGQNEMSIYENENNDIFMTREQIGQALEYKNEVTITTYARGQYETFTGVIRNADPNTKMITFQSGFNQLKVSANMIVEIE